VYVTGRLSFRYSEHARLTSWKPSSPVRDISETFSCRASLNSRPRSGAAEMKFELGTEHLKATVIICSKGMTRRSRQAGMGTSLPGCQGDARSLSTKTYEMVASPGLISITALVGSRCVMLSGGHPRLLVSVSKHGCGTRECRAGSMILAGRCVAP
jgi:hypothetical protein